MSEVMEVQLVCRLDDIMRLKPFVSTEEIRFYLSGVRFEQGIEGVLLVATDGHRLGVFNAKNAICRDGGIVKLPTRLPKINKRFAAWLIVGQFAGADIALIMAFNPAATPEEIVEAACLNNALAIFPRPLIDGTYPNWRKVLPAEIGAAGAFFNSAYLADFASATGQKKGAAITIFGADPAAPHVVSVAGEDNFIGVQMPMRAEGITEFPTWLEAPKPKKNRKTQ